MTRRSHPPRHSPVILAHGGAGERMLTPPQRECLYDALIDGYEILRHGGSSLEAVERTICFLEVSGVFNAGTGARLQLDGCRRMDASIMDGHTLRAGAVAGIEQIRHPISAARLVMEKTAHVMLIGTHATQFARHFKLERQSAPSKEQRSSLSKAWPRGVQHKTLSLFQELEERETVGAVALDVHGHLAAGASTGGISFMLPGRVGDTPLIGCGVYADDAAGAVSMTGIGEDIIRLAIAQEVVDRLATGVTPSAATQQTMMKLVKRLRGQAGALVLAPNSRFTIRHTTPHMCAGHWNGRGEPVVADQFHKHKPVSLRDFTGLN